MRASDGGSAHARALPPSFVALALAALVLLAAAPAALASAAASARPLPLLRRRRPPPDLRGCSTTASASPRTCDGVNPFSSWSSVSWECLRLGYDFLTWYDADYQSGPGHRDAAGRPPRTA